MSSTGAAAREYKTNIDSLDISGYSVNDTIRLAYYKYDSNLSNIIIKFYSSDTAYYQVTVSPASGTGNKITSDILIGTLLSGATNPSPDPTSITKIGIVITPTSGNNTSVGMDALRVNDEDTFDATFGLISRSVLSTTLNKLAGRQVDVEYRLDLTF
jgi:hypothetical protein